MLSNSAESFLHKLYNFPGCSICGGDTGTTTQIQKSSLWSDTNVY